MYVLVSARLWKRAFFLNKYANEEAYGQASQTEFRLRVYTWKRKFCRAEQISFGSHRRRRPPMLEKCA